MADLPDTDLDSRTEEVEEHDALASPSDSPEPTPDEEAAAERAPPADPAVAEKYREQLRTGAEHEGEGAIDLADDGRPPQVP